MRLARPRKVSLAISDVLEPFARSLAVSHAERTIETYREAVQVLLRYRTERGLSLELTAIRPAEIDELTLWLKEHKSPGTASVRYRALQQFFRYCVDNDLLTVSPMAKLHPPKVTAPLVRTLREEDVRRLLKTCEGKDFLAVRDLALILLFVDTGLRKSEMANIRLADIDLKHHNIPLVGKGGKRREVTYQKGAAKALDKYIFARMRHRQRELPWLWLGHAGRLTPTGVYQAVIERAKQAGLADVHPHVFRHTFSDLSLRNGASGEELMQLTGWSSRTMLMRYGAQLANERAREAHKRFSPVDHLLGL